MKIGIPKNVKQSIPPTSIRPNSPFSNGITSHFTIKFINNRSIIKIKINYDTIDPNYYLSTKG